MIYYRKQKRVTIKPVKPNLNTQKCPLYLIAKYYYLFSLTKGGIYMISKIRKYSKPSLFIVFLFTLILSVLYLSGCSAQKTEASSIQSTNNTTSSNINTNTNTDNANNGTTNSAPDNTKTVKLTLYFPTSNGNGLAPVVRNVSVTNEETINAIMKELANPPAGLEKALPNGTKLLDASVKNGVATINLSKEFRQNFQGGETEEQLMIYSIVDSLTNLPNIQSVQFLLEGQKKAAILSQFDTTTPITRNNQLIVKGQ